MEVDYESEPKFFKKDLSQYGQILALELSPFQLSQDIILVGFTSKVLLCHLTIKNFLELDILAEFEVPASCSGLSISPETCISGLPVNVLFCSIGSDFKLRIFHSDLKNINNCKVLDAHTSYVNDAKYDADNQYVASTGDDNTVKIWTTDQYSCKAMLKLTSPGMSVAWNQEESLKLLVAEKVGIIRFFNIETQTPIQSLEYGRPLCNTDWAPSNSQLVVSLHMGELVVWDISKPSAPINKNLIFSESGGIVRINPLGKLVALVNTLESCLKVINTHSHRQKLSVAVTSPYAVSWHMRYPVVCVGDYNALCFWKIV